AGPRGPAIQQRHHEPDVVSGAATGRGDRADVTGHHLPPVPADLGPAAGQQLRGGNPVVGQQPVYPAGRGVTRGAGVDHHHGPAGPGQRQRPAQSGGPTADHYHVVVVVQSLSRHDVSMERARATPRILLQVWQTGAVDGDFAQVVGAVGSRLRTLRRQRSLTLSELSAATGISVSTLSRLESGARRPTLELLLPLARAYGVTLDELVDAPPTGDPRITFRPVTEHGMTTVPLTRRPGRIPAYTLTVHPRAAEPEPEPR